MWHQKGFVLLALLASVSHGFRFQNEKETAEGHTTKVIETSEDVQIGEDSKTRDQRKIEPLVEDVDREAIIEDAKENPAEEEEQEEIQARFFLKDKLCALGLADVSF